MKWFSVKKYSPLPNRRYLIIDKKRHSFCAEWDSSMRLWADDEWFCNKGTITHFAEIPPVEIEEDEEVAQKEIPLKEGTYMVCRTCTKQITSLPWLIGKTGYYYCSIDCMREEE